MRYADSDYYYNEYGGSECVEDVERILERASGIVDMLTGYRISREGFERLGERQCEAVKRAVCAQADLMERNGGDTSEPAEVTIGRFRYVNASESEGKGSGGVYSAEAISILGAAGLLYRGVEVVF